MISRRLISRFPFRSGLFAQSQRVHGRICDQPVKLSQHSSQLISRIPQKCDFFSGASENFKDRARLHNNVVPNFLGNLGIKLRFSQANSLPSTLKFASSIHSAGPKEFEEGRDNRSIEAEWGPFDMGQNQMDGNRTPFDASSDTSSFGKNVNIDMNGLWEAGKDNGPIETGGRNRHPPGMPRDGRSFGRNAGPFEMRPNEMDRIRTPFDMSRGNTSSFGRDVRPTRDGTSSRRDIGPFEMRPNEMDRVRIPLDTTRGNTSSFGMDVRPTGTDRNTFIKGIMEDSVSDIIGGGSRHSRYGVEQNPDIVHIKLMRNNTFVTVTDSKGNKKFGASTGSLPDMRGGQKVSRYSAEAAAEHVGRVAKKMGLKSVVIKVNGFTYFKKKRQAILSFRDGYTNSKADQNPVVYIEDTTRKPHNGCRLRKKRRI